MSKKLPKGMYKCPSCKREHYFKGEGIDELWDFDKANVFSTSSLNKDEQSRYIPRCSCGNVDNGIFYKMVKIRRNKMSEDFKEALEKVKEEVNPSDILFYKYFWDEAISKCERIMEDSCIHGFFPIIHAMKSLK